jgi:hypothetical protein
MTDPTYELPRGAMGAIAYGSRLYGTSTPTSDWDFKVVVMPDLEQLLLAKPLRVARDRRAADGSPVGEHDTMPPDGVEGEVLPVHKLVGDFLGGQAWAVEFAHAVAGDPGRLLRGRQLDAAHSLVFLCETLVGEFTHKNVAGMVGFAVKQTMDYVHRGERLNAARALLAALDAVDYRYMELVDAGALSLDAGGLRLDSELEGQNLLDLLVERTGCKVGETSNQGKKMRTLELNGRSYLETTRLDHLRAAVKKLVDSYGARSAAAAEVDVDWKSLSHAVRVYEQVLELLATGRIAFPRPNAAELVEIKAGRVPLEAVRDRLRALDAEVLAAVEASALPEVDDGLRGAADVVLLEVVRDLSALS